MRMFLMELFHLSNIHNIIFPAFLNESKWGYEIVSIRPPPPFVLGHRSS